MKSDIEELLRSSGGVIRRADHPKLKRRFDGLLYRKSLETPLPGIICVPGAVNDLQAAVRAGWLWAGPDAVLVGHAAAKLTFWPEIEVSAYEFAVPRDRQCTYGRFRLTHREIPPELIWTRDDIQLSAPALTAIDLAAGGEGGDVIDRALRTRTTTIVDLQTALRLTPNRAGNAKRSQLLADSKDSPWSTAERMLHRLLRTNKITSWKANQWVSLKNLDPSRGAYVDVLFKKQKLVLEVDGYEFHSDHEAFEKDRKRRNELVLAGYLVLNFTWQQITENPDWVINCVRRALKLLA